MYTTSKTMATLAENLITQALLGGGVPEIVTIKKCITENEICVLCACISEQLDFRFDIIIEKNFMRDTEKFLKAVRRKSYLYWLFGVYFGFGEGELSQEKSDLFRNINL